MNETTKRMLAALPRTDAASVKQALLKGKAGGLPERKISERTCRMYDYDLASYRQQQAQVANYRDENGLTVAQHVRYGDKQFAWIGREKGLKLLDRTTRRVELTAVGREFLPQARNLVTEMTSALDQLKDMSAYARGQFTLACVPSMTSHVLPQVIKRYADLYPGNRIRLLDASSHEVRQAVLHGQAEIGIAVNGEKHPDLKETVLFEDPLC